MRALAILSSLLRGLVLCGVGGLGFGAAVSQAGWFSSETPCSVPAGLYNVQQLGAGYDSLNFTVTSSGDVRGTYRLLAGMDAHHYPASYEVWLDSNSSNIQCYGDTIELSAGDSYHSLTLALVWNRALSKLDATGSYTGDASWARWGVKNGLTVATITALIYTGVYLYRHQTDVKFFAQTLEVVRLGEKKILGSGTAIHTGVNWLTGFDTAGVGYWVWWWALKKYLLEMHLYDFSFPAAGALTGMLTTPLIGNTSTYPLRGMGGQVIAGGKGGHCTIPAGLYQGTIHDPAQGALEITVPIGLNNSETPPKALVSSASHVSSYNITPSTLTCRGNQLILEWSSSSSSSSKGYLAVFYSKEKGVIGTGFLASSGLWRYGKPILMPAVQLEVSQPDPILNH
ncbi:hypothetical protein [Parendozoicomonas sp. Alg238-R29]|uniref:hypothetical protein n=1 Tax=Parendozoicomonas sp. Alg238-R29 TaxID=2993446 RepID=UPI00248DAF87|nr:hypothetical protein [Parendozoicomonas sp. Alg238-R29]